MDNCLVTNNKIHKANWLNELEDFKLEETNTVYEGDIYLQEVSKLDSALHRNYLHVMPDSLGYNLGAGLFKQEK